MGVKKENNQILYHFSIFEVKDRKIFRYFFFISSLNVFFRYSRLYNIEFLLLSFNSKK